MSYKSTRFKRSSPAMSDINVTPLVDVMMVLLVIFMVTAPLSLHGLDIQLPQVDTKAMNKEEKWVITVYRDMSIHFNEQPIELGDLEKRLEELAGGNPSVEVFMKADEALSYGYVVKVMAAARKAGVTNLGMVTEPLAIIKQKE